MTVVLKIRKTILGIRQCDLAVVAGVSQATVCRWEKGELHPSLVEICKIRDYAINHNIHLDDRFWFEGDAVQSNAASHSKFAALHWRPLTAGPSVPMSPINSERHKSKDSFKHHCPVMRRVCATRDVLQNVLSHLHQLRFRAIRTFHVRDLFQSFAEHRTKRE